MLHTQDWESALIDRMDFACYTDFCRMLCVLRWDLYLCGEEQEK